MSDFQDHHLIPRELENHPVVKALVRGKGFIVNLDITVTNDFELVETANENAHSTKEAA